ncbi:MULTISPECIES: DMT family transporter [Pseudonocardia]|uniref:EamA-like transporter family protein n=2 Tax=Pseudonocardia TaxID=1847 RepID=A0A1Y2MRG6_PSEAH|nr:MULTISPECIES: DMT family transporter [Pseudonocardia]OSY37731.1 EamA-like transporter family protein [Pseudonocardia autotrophica]TDN75779.1 threonine/homoserine efflux transporter RhtA [Pseudonocardia autotrophica]BBF99750.1 multidrug DMT transporter permease [Pseudonocardia autotrophica]GEC27108.1 multidrug DMT transporter permease [Pseudonocardia saturnea]
MSRPGLVGATVSLLGATLFWAGNYIVGARAVQSIDPFSLTLLRWVLALPLLLALAQLIERPDWRQVLAAWRWLLALSFFGLLAYTGFLYAALEATSAFNASLINAFNPALIALAGAVFLRERLTPLAVAGILVALIGVLIVVTDGDPASVLRTGFGPGELLMLGAITAWTGYAVVGRRVPPLPPIASTAAQAAVAVLLLAPIGLLTGVTLPGDPASTGSLLFIVVFPSVLSYLLWTRALLVLPAGSAGVFLNLITVFTAAFTIIVGDPYTSAQVVGGLVVIAGVVLTNGGHLRRRPG